MENLKINSYKLKTQLTGIELCAFLIEKTHFFNFTGMKKYILYILKREKGKIVENKKYICYFIIIILKKERKLPQRQIDEN